MWAGNEAEGAYDERDRGGAGTEGKPGACEQEGEGGARVDGVHGVFLMDPGVQCGEGAGAEGGAGVAGRGEEGSVEGAVGSESQKFTGRNSQMPAQYRIYCMKRL